MKKMLVSPHLFALWWLVTVPKQILTALQRVIKLINSIVSFTVNLRLLFTPLWGDYTVIGRFIGFTIRIFEVVFGLAIMGVLVVITPFIPLIWLILPVYLFYSYGAVALVYLVILYVLWAVNNYNTPDKKVSECTSDFIRSFRPSCLTVLAAIKVNQRAGLTKLAENKKVSLLLARLELTNSDFIDKLATAVTFDSELITKGAFDFAKESSATYTAEVSLFMSIIKSIQKPELFLANFETNLRTVEAGAKWLISEREKRNALHIWQEKYDGLSLGGFGKGMTFRATPFLDTMSEDYTKQAGYYGFERFAVRKNAIAKVADLLSASNENILIVGQAGSGKTSLVKGMAYEIMRGTSYKSLWNKRIVKLELSGIVAGTRSVGDVAEKIRTAIGEAKNSRNIILFIDEIHSLLGGSDGSNPEMSAIFNMLEPELSTGNIQFIGATSLQGYRKYIEPNSSFARLFNLYELPEASEEETFKILEFVVRDLERTKKVFITYKALDKCIELSKKLIHERVLPDKAVQIIDRAATYTKENDRIIDSKLIAEVIADLTHVPSAVLKQNEAEKLLSLETEMTKMVIGQNHAIKQIASSLMRARTGMRNQNKPIASFLFVGTTGVGKTETAKALATSFFGDAKAMTRLDMSEYQQLDSISRLLGTPDGSTRGQLTEAVRTKPFSLILLDEIEKAHSNILLTFLQVLDDGRLTDSNGTTVDFTNAIIIATSNTGTRAIQDIFAQNGTLDQMTESAMRDVRAGFAPEFLNRFTGIIVFNPLSEAAVHDICKLLLKNVSKAADDQNISIAFTDELITELIKRGYNKEWGARPLARVIEDSVETYIAERILRGELKPGTQATLGVEIFAH